MSVALRCCGFLRGDLYGCIRAPGFLPRGDINVEPALVLVKPQAPPLYAGGGSEEVTFALMMT